MIGQVMRFLKNGLKILEMYKPGQKVHYAAKPGDFVQRHKNGIVKSVVENGAWVVFYCLDDWEHYLDYHAQITPFDNLSDGWLTKSTIN